MPLTWEFQERLWLTSKPRFLNSETISRDESYITKFAFKEYFFLDILTSLHFLILKSILFSRLQLQRLSGSRWNKTWSWGLSIIREVLQSPAYRAIVFPGEMQSGVSLIKTTKNGGPRMAPWGIPDETADHDPCKLSCKSATVSQSTTRYHGYVVFYQSVHALASQETSRSPSQLTRDSPAILLAISVLANLSVTFLFSQSISHYSPDSHSTRHLYSEKQYVNHRSERSSSKRVGTRHSGLARSNLCALSSLEWRGGLRSFWTWLSVSNEVSAYGRTGEKMVS